MLHRCELSVLKVGSCHTTKTSAKLPYNLSLNELPFRFDLFRRRENELCYPVVFYFCLNLGLLRMFVNEEELVPLEEVISEAFLNHSRTWQGEAFPTCYS